MSRVITVLLSAVLLSSCGFVTKEEWGRGEVLCANNLGIDKVFHSGTVNCNNSAQFEMSIFAG